MFRGLIPTKHKITPIFRDEYEWRVNCMLRLLFFHERCVKKGKVGDNDKNKTKSQDA